MAKKSTTDDDSTQTSQSSTQPTTDTKKRNPLIYVAILVIVVIVAFIAYSLLSNSSGNSLSSKQILNNISNSSLNQTQTLFVNDLKRSENVSSLHVEYYSSNATQYVKQSNNLTIAINSNMTIDSYKLGNYNKSVLSEIVSYTNSKNGDVIAENVSDLYYYNTNTTVICFNDTSYSSGLVSNSSLQCYSGDQGQSYIEQAPFTAVNVSSLSYLAFNNSVTYGGTKTIAGRNCDSFIISNGTAANLQSNYSVFDLCIDTQYGILLYFNQTYVVNGVPSSQSFSATSVSTNVPSSEFVIPQSYLSTIQKSII